ncbi:MAG: formate/nitrite transporter family protein [Ruminococcaceae bacterium]|nr:formate/nitrite transporter family protein [Oscillospiraceae bacterium]
MKTVILSIAAGFCIGVGGIVFLAQSNKIAGAFLFAVGLLTILVFRFNLFTGMVGYVLENLMEKKWSYLLTVLLVWIGNFAGTALASLLVGLTRLGDGLAAACEGIVQTKLNDSWYSLLLLGVFCGMLMFIAVDTFKKRIGEKDFLCVVAVFMGVMVFILAGFEHSIADMFYFCLTGTVGKAIPALLWITLGNAIGGNLIPLFQKLTQS